MAYHVWGEEEFDWEGLNDAIHYIADNLRRWGRVNITSVKEKYGQGRIYLFFGWSSIAAITHPGYAYIQYKRDSLLWRLNYSPLMSWLFGFINLLIVPYHRWLYVFFYARALKKWPHLAEELLDGADEHELLKEKGLYAKYSIPYTWVTLRSGVPDDDPDASDPTDSPDSKV